MSSAADSTAVELDQATMPDDNEVAIDHIEDIASDGENDSDAASHNGENDSNQTGWGDLAENDHGDASEDGWNQAEDDHGDADEEEADKADDEAEGEGDDQFQPACTTATCQDGWLASIADLQAVATDYTVPTSLPHEPVCPTCIGADLMKEHQSLRAEVEAFTFVDLGRVVEFTGRLNVRRTALGYEFKQLDEREWGYHFDDMLSDGQYQYLCL